MEKLVLIDGHSILNRAFYGVPGLTNSGRASRAGSPDEGGSDGHGHSDLYERGL